MGKNTVRVVARLRPTDHFASCIHLQDDNKTVEVHTSRKSGTEVVNNTVEAHQYKVDLVLKDASQEAVFETCAADIVKSVMTGINGSIMCYGQTGAGKTYSMMGGSDYRTRGLIPRIVKAIFDETAAQADKQFEIRVSYLEVYNDRLYDLLDPDAEEDFAVLEDAKGNVSVRGVTPRVCQQEAEALSYLFTGNTNRSVAEHALNVQSSRSHCIFTVHVTSRSRVESESASLVGKLHCVDLAGSERLAKTGSEGKTVREAQYINKSLAFLEQVVMALGSTHRSHVPFRQSKLTAILKDSLGGNSKTTMIANIWPEDRHLEETTSTLKFASRMMRVQSDPTVNVLLDPATHIKQLQRQIADLKSELQMQNQLHGKSHITYDGEIGDDEKFEMEKVVRTYLTGKLPEVPVRSLREVREYFRIFKAFIDQRDAEGGAASSRGPAGVAEGSAAMSLKAAPPAASGAGRRLSVDTGAGALDPSTGMSIGVAAPAKSLRDFTKASPARGSVPAATGSETPRAAAQDSGATAEVSKALLVASGSAALPDRNVAFLEYKRGPEGTRLSTALKEHQDQLAEKRKIAAETSIAVNECKVLIDAASQELEQRRQDRFARGEEELVDDEEFELVKRVKAHKAEYRRLYDMLTTTKTARDHLVRLVDHSRHQMLTSYETWFEKMYGGDSGASAADGGASRGLKGGRPRRTVADDDGEALDEGERFEQLEMQRVMDEDPESVDYYRAKKMTTAKAAQQRKAPAPTRRR